MISPPQRFGPRLARVAIGVALVLAGRHDTRGEDSGAAPPRHPRNVVLISIDSLRADHLPIYGYPRDTAPFLRRMAAMPGASVFERFTAVAPSCHPAHTAMLTGLYPQQVGVAVCGEDLVFRPADALDDDDVGRLAAEQDRLREQALPLVRKKASAVMNWLRIPEGTPTLATFFKGRGYRTAGFVSIWTIQGKFGYGHGFDVFADEMPDYYGPKRLAWLLKDVYGSQIRREGRETLALALDYLEGYDGSAPLFLFVHFADTHVPYHAPPDVRLPEQSEAQRAELRRWWSERYTDAAREAAMRRMASGDEFLLDRYDRSIRYVDSLVERLFERLRKKGMLDDTLVVVTSDHGDSFGQHLNLEPRDPKRPFFEHSIYVWEETLHVPLIVLDPSRKGASREVGANASTVDLVPTVRAAVGLDAAPWGNGTLPGRNLAHAGAESRRVYFVSWGRGRPGILQHFRTDFPRFLGFREGDLKFFLNKPGIKADARGRCFLFDLAADPHEKTDLCDDAAWESRVERYKRELTAWYNETVANRGQLAAPPP